MNKPGFLIYHSGALGDFITILPALSTLRKHLPRYRFVLLGKPAIAGIALENGIVDQCRDIDQAMFGRLFSFPPESLLPTDILDEFDTALVFAAADSPLVFSLNHAGIKRVIRVDPFPRSLQPMALNHLEIVRNHFKISGSDPGFLELYQNNSAPDAIIGKKTRRIALHPGSGSSIKNWPIENFIELRNRLVHLRFTVVWLVGPAEGSITIPEGDMVLSCQPWRAMASILRQCSLFVGNDSGMAHFAAAVACPVLVVFGPSDHRIWKPYGPVVTTITPAPRYCFPCHDNHRSQTVCKRTCVSDIPAGKVFETVLKCISN